MFSCTQISPVFASNGITKTPMTGDRYANGPGRRDTREELEALFEMIGTPTWACVEAVKSDAWRNYLRNLPLRSAV